MALITIILICGIAAVQSQGLNTLFTFPEDVKELNDRIIQGWPAAETQFPHQVYLKSNGKFFCGGSLISPRWVLTAGHCIEYASSLTVHLGEINRSKPGLVVQSKRAIIHPDYVHVPLNRFQTLKNDIGLIDLGEEVELTDKIRPIRLPAKDATDLVGKIVTASGWGRTTPDGGNPNDLQYVNLTIISNTECAKYFPTELIVDAVICTKGIESPAQGICMGDSGGPLIFYGDDDTPTLIGVVSFTTLDCDSPSGYFRPQFYLDWINDTMEKWEKY